MKKSQFNNSNTVHKSVATFLAVLTAASVLSTYFSLQHIMSVQAEELDRDAMAESIKSEVHKTVNEELSSDNSSDEGESDNNDSSGDKLTNTGDDVTASSENESKSETDVKIKNEADINQTISAEANTGNNVANRNISIGGNAGVIRTGDADVTAKGVVNANNNQVGITGSSGSGGSGSDVVNTGNGGSHTSDSSSHTSTRASNYNRATIYQGADTKANTGNNIADKNISIGGNAGEIITGAASTKTSYLVTANQTVMLIGGDSDGNGPGSGATIVTTGDRHSSMIRANNHKSTSVNNNNSAFITQTCGVNSSCVADTGNNTSSRNINRNGDAGVIKTGNALVKVGMYASANSNSTGIYTNGMGYGLGYLDIMNTGDDSNFNSSAENQNQVKVINSNYASVDQHVNAYANTGNNIANRNIAFGGDAGVIETGDAIVEACMVADVNDNSIVITQGPVGGVQPTPEPTASPTPSPSVSPTPSPKPTATPKPIDNDKDNDNNNGKHHDDNGRGGVHPESIANNPVSNTYNKLAQGGVAPGQVLAATTDISPATFAATGLSVNWMGILKALIVLMIGYTLGSVRHILIRGNN